MRRRLVLFSLATTSIVLIAFLVPLVSSVQRLARERAVDDTLRRVQTVAGLLSAVRDPALEQALLEELDPELQGRVTVSLSTGRVIGDAMVAGDARVVREARQSLRVARGPGPAGSMLVALPVQRPGGSTTVIRALVPREELRRGVNTAYLILAGLTVVLLLLVVTVARRLARGIAAPVEGLAQAARRLEQGDLGARVDESGGPEELRAVSRAFNDLAARVGELLAEEREGVASLSHRLRTPLTALRLDVERLPDARAAARLPSTVDALVAAVDQVIRDARQAASDARRQTVDLQSVVAARLHEFQRLGAADGRHWEMRVQPGRYRLDVDGQELAAAVDALLTNVLQHTPLGTCCRVLLEPRPDGHCLLVVEDDGRGLPDDVLLARGTSTSGSTGLGLDIARTTAMSTGGSLWLARSESGGTRVELDFGPPAPAEDGQRGVPLRRSPTPPELAAVSGTRLRVLGSGHRRLRRFAPAGVAAAVVLAVAVPLVRAADDRVTTGRGNAEARQSAGSSPGLPALPADAETPDKQLAITISALDDLARRDPENVGPAGPYVLANLRRVERLERGPRRSAAVVAATAVSGAVAAGELDPAVARHVREVLHNVAEPERLIDLVQLVGADPLAVGPGGPGLLEPLVALDHQVPADQTATSAADLLRVVQDGTADGALSEAFAAAAVPKLQELADPAPYRALQDFVADVERDPGRIGPASQQMLTSLRELTTLPVFPQGMQARELLDLIRQDVGVTQAFRSAVIPVLVPVVR